MNASTRSQWPPPVYTGGFRAEQPNERREKEVSNASKFGFGKVDEAIQNSLKGVRSLCISFTISQTYGQITTSSA